MLTPDELIDAFHNGLKAAAVCSDTFCRAGAEIDEGRYRCWHNGTGSRDTDLQMVTATPVLSLNKEQLAGKVKAWAEKLHTGIRTDLNATMATGGPISGAPYLVGDRGPAMIGWPWRWTDGAPA